MEPNPSGVWGLPISEGVISSIVSLILGIAGAWLVFRGKLAETAQARETAIWDASREIREELAERIAVLEADRDRMTAQIADLREERVNDSYVRAYASLLWELFPNPPGAPPPPPVVAKLLGLEPKPDGEEPPTPQIRDPTDTE